MVLGRFQQFPQYAVPNNTRAVLFGLNISCVLQICSAAAMSAACGVPAMSVGTAAGGQSSFSVCYTVAVLCYCYSHAAQLCAKYMLPPCKTQPAIMLNFRKKRVMDCKLVTGCKCQQCDDSNTQEAGPTPETDEHENKGMFTICHLRCAALRCAICARVVLASGHRSQVGWNPLTRPLFSR